MKITTSQAGGAAAAALAAGLTACGIQAGTLAAHQPATPAVPAVATQRAPARAAAKASAAATMTAAHKAAMNKWYSGATVIQVAHVCGDVSQVFSDDDAVSAGRGSSSLETDITRLHKDVATALDNPPPVAADAVIWKRILSAYSNAAGGPTSAGLVAASRRATHAPWAWTPSPGVTLLVCLSTSI